MSRNAKVRLDVASDFPNYGRAERLFNFFEHLSTSETPENLPCLNVCPGYQHQI